MSIPAFFPYRSEAIRDAYFAYYDSLTAKQWPLRSQERMIPTSYGQTFVRISGPAGAPPLVLLPGAVGTSLLWAPNVGALSEDFRTIAVDQIGDIGRTTCTRPVSHVNDLLGWLDELFDALAPGNPINIVGVSYGGWLALQYAQHAPQRVRAIIPLAPGGAVLRLSARFMLSLALAALATRWFFRPVFGWIFADAARKDPAWLNQLIEHMLVNMRSLAPRTLPMPSLWTDAEWQSLSVPTLFLVGEHEVIYSPGKALRRLKRAAPQVTAELIPGAGHDLSFAQAELVNRRIIQFLKQHSAATVAREAGCGWNSLHWRFQ